MKQMIKNWREIESLEDTVVRNKETNTIEFGENVEIDGNLKVNSDAEIDGDLKAKSDIDADGKIKIESAEKITDKQGNPIQFGGSSGKTLRFDYTAESYGGYTIYYVNSKGEEKTFDMPEGPEFNIIELEDVIAFNFGGDDIHFSLNVGINYTVETNDDKTYYIPLSNHSYSYSEN